MMNKLLRTSGIAAIVSILFFTSSIGMAAAQKNAWAEVDEAVKKGRPKTAIELLEPIIESALERKAYPEAVRGIARRIKLEGDIQGHKAEEKIVRLEKELAAAPPQMHPIMETVLGHWYWQYFQQNRWRFMQRTQTAEPPGDDILTWDLARILAEIDEHFTIALSARETLRKIPIADWGGLLQKGNMPDSFRPTLYDFVAHEALAFYMAGEQAGAKAQDAFDLSAASPVFDTADAFMGWKIETTEDDAPTVKALRLMQELMLYHEDDSDRSAFIDVDLVRLQFGYNKAFGETKSDRYKTALERFVKENAEHRVSARAIAAWAGVLNQEDQAVEAHRMASRAAKRFPDTPGGNQCHNLVQQIEAKSYQVATERVWTDPWPTIAVTYRNLDKIHLRAVKYDWEDLITRKKRWGWEDLDHKERESLLRKRAAKAWSADLPPTPDYRERQEMLPVPRDLEPGFYFLISSHSPRFDQKDNIVDFTSFWVSKLALVMRNQQGSGHLQGFVLDARSGVPVKDAVVRCWRRENDGKKVPGAGRVTDANGLFRLPVTDRKSHRVLATHDGHSIATMGDQRVHRRHTPSPDMRAVYFTDRSIYRPGQTIRYKGICFRVDTEGDNYRTLAGKALTVLFRDVNGKEIARQKQQANDHGSFSGSFTAPADRLMGRMTIQTDGDPDGRTHFRVEEYKRPKFKVTFDPPAEAARLDDDVTLTGHAMAYTGAAVDGAKVRYRVLRNVRFPPWWRWYCWWWPPNPGSSQEIEHGQTRTDTDGSFRVTFKAVPDRTVAKESEPTFSYTVYADVTDNAGETRSAQRAVNAGYTALKASMSAADWQENGKPVEITVTTQTLNDEPLSAEVRVRIHKLKEPDKVHRARLPGHRPYWRPRYRSGTASRSAGAGSGSAPPPDLSDPNSWELGRTVFEEQITTSSNGVGELSAELDRGLYRAVLTTQDRYGNEVKGLLPIRVLDPGSSKCALKIPNVVAAPSWSLEPGETFKALWGTGYDTGPAFVEIERRGEMLQAYWTTRDRTQQLVEQDVKENMRGGFTLRVTHVRENRAYIASHKVSVPWSNKQLKMKWERLVSKLEPGQKETWTASIEGPDAEKAVAEMAATLYDESLDAFLPHQWMKKFNVFYQDRARVYSQFNNSRKGLHRLHGQWATDYRDASTDYRSLPNDLTAHYVLWGWGYGARGRRGFKGAMLNRLGSRAACFAAAPLAEGAEVEAGMAFNGVAMAKSPARALGGDAPSSAPGEPPAPPAPDLDNVSARKNLQETAFFFPQLMTDSNGVARIQFTMPEALTQWKFMGFAHDRDLRSGYLEATAVTAKDIMVQPNPPRFLREGDVLEFSVKITNMSDKPQAGTARLSFCDARTLEPVDDLLFGAERLPVPPGAGSGAAPTDQAFSVPAGQSRSYSWRIRVPDGMGFLTYKAVGSTGSISDGEEGYLPVLPRRIMVTESLPLPIRDAGTKKFTFEKLRKSGESDTLRHQGLVVQMVSNPSWYAVMALPYLMEYPHQCSEQIFNRLYANSLGRHIAKSDPKIRRIFDLWKGTEALDSPLEKNQDLKSVMLEETPWVRQGENESQARRNVGILFDDHRLDREASRAMRQLAQMQFSDGAWPWFPGGRPNDYVTLYITTGFGRLRHLGVKDIDMGPAVRSLNRLDNWIDRRYHEILRYGGEDNNNLTSTIALYLYARSFFLEDRAIKSGHRDAVDYFLGQAAKYWLKLPRQSQAHLALAVQRFGKDQATPQNIVKSLKEFSVTNEEMGMFWRDTEYSWWWYRAPIETQAMMIEAFAEVAGDEEAVEECQVWLLKQKQTQDWKTTKATADAVYALLLRGADMLASDELVQVSLAGEKIEPQKVEAGTGFYEERFGRSEVRPEMGEITVTKVDKGVAWGGVHWQYFEDISKITPHEATPLTLKKALFVKENTKQGPVLRPVKDTLRVGDELVTRIVLRVDRDMEYVHMKDQRGSGTEPVNVLSVYKYQDGLRYYESTKDTASHFFIDYLPKGTYVFEYSSRVQHKGEYHGGMALIECMYAPEFNSHSGSIMLKVR